MLFKMWFAQERQYFNIAQKMLPKKRSYMTWKFGQFLDPPSCWQARANDPHEVLKIGSQHRVVIPFYEIKNFGVVTELGA